MSRATRILIVDDEPEVRRYLADLLVKSGFDVSVAEDGAEAHELIQQAPGRFDLVITDISMETMDGIELGEKMRALCPSVPVLYISAYLETCDPAIATRHFLAKPFSSRELLAKIRQLTTPETG
jgi:CheY-like chemotaxis protein